MALLLALHACNTPPAPLAASGGSHGSKAHVLTSATHHRAPAAWRSAARANDWASVAALIDALPVIQRAEPATRYVRALAALRLGNCGDTLSALDGLAESLPMLAGEIAAMTAECQLELGPFTAAAEYYAQDGSHEGQLRAARAWQRAGQLEQAYAIVDRTLRVARLKPYVRTEARSLRAQIASRLGWLERARSDYYWLATQTTSPGADDAYETLAGVRLSKADRLRRAEAFAHNGDAAGTLRELERLKRGSGKRPPDALMLRATARAYFRSHDQYGKAAALFERAAMLAEAHVTNDLFSAATSWSRARNVGRAKALYEQIMRRFRGTPAAERALYSLARLFYSHGHWRDAERAYDRYLRRHSGRGRAARYLAASLYERSIAQLAAGRQERALEGIHRLQRSALRQYPRAMLLHLEGVALASSEENAARRKAEALFREVIGNYPLSFAALASAQRLAKMGLSVPLMLTSPAAPEPVDDSLTLPPNVRVLAELGLHSAAERALYAQEDLLRRRYRPRSTEKLCGLYESLDRGWRRYAVGRGVVRDQVLWNAPTKANLWAWNCLYPRPFEDAVSQLESRYELPPALMYAVMRQESGFRQDVRSPVGALGLMQLMPATAKRAASELGIEHEHERLTQVRYNLELGAFYLGKLLDGFEQRVVLALAGYNAGPHAVSRWLDGGRDLPLDLWVARIPYGETRSYVMRVMTNWARYRYLHGGPSAIPRLSLTLPAEIQLMANAY